MSITLAPDFEAMVREKVAIGQFADEVAVVEEALLLLDRRDRLQQLRVSLDEADNEIDQSGGEEWTPNLLNQLTAEAQDDFRRGAPISGDVKP